MRVAIIGCGKISESHASIISGLHDVEFCAACDIEELMAKQLYERYGAKSYYSNYEKMLEEVEPTVVHITTPPRTHFKIAKRCLEAGCHIFVEKPFTLNYEEARTLIEIAKKNNKLLTVGTDEQFSNISIRARELIKRGWLGGTPVHMEVYHCYDLGDEKYARVFLQDRDHWVWNLPGQLIQNIIPHPVMRIAEYIQSEELQIITKGFTSNRLALLGEKLLKDEFRTMIIDRNKTTAYITFSTQMKPPLFQFRIYGPENGLIIDQGQHTLIKLYGKRYKSYIEKIIPSMELSKQYKKNAFYNMKLFFKREFQMKRGLYNLIVLFYRSILENTDVPIPYDKILISSKIIDSIVNDLYKGGG